MKHLYIILAFSFFLVFMNGNFAFSQDGRQDLLSQVRERLNSNNLKKCELSKRSIWTMKLQSGL